MDSLLWVMWEYIVEEVKNKDLLAIQTDKTTGLSTQCQLVVVLHYIDKTNQVQEHFYSFTSIQTVNAETIAGSILEQLAHILQVEGWEEKYRMYMKKPTKYTVKHTSSTW